MKNDHIKKSFPLLVACPASAHVQGTYFIRHVKGLMGHAQSPANVRRSEVIPLTSSLRIRWKAPVNGACIDRYLVVVRPRVPVAGSDAREQETYQVGSSSNDFRWACAAHARTQLTAAAHTMIMCGSNHV